MTTTKLQGREKYVELMFEHPIGDIEIIAHKLAEMYFPIKESEIYYTYPGHDNYRMGLPANKSAGESPDIEVIEMGENCGKRYSLIKLKISSLQNEISSQLEKELNKLVRVNQR